MPAVQGKVTAFIGLTKESLDGASDSLDGNREIKRRLIDRHNMMTRLWWTASARQLLLQGYGCISSVYISFQMLYHIAFRSFYAGLSCIYCLHINCPPFPKKYWVPLYFLLLLLCQYTTLTSSSSAAPCVDRLLSSWLDSSLISSL